MKLTNTHFTYFYTALLFVFSFVLTKELFKAYNTNKYDYLQLGIYTVLVITSVFQILKYANLVNNKKE